MKSNPSCAGADRDFDVLIVGGGMVGTALALALRPLGLSIGIVEALPAGELPAAGGFDARATALAWASHTILEAIGVWPLLASSATPIMRVHVSEHRRFGSALLEAADAGLPALGHVVENPLLLRALASALEGSGIEQIRPATVTGVDAQADHVTATVAGRTLRARLLVVADGARSATRDLLGITARVHDYEQTALVTNVTTRLPHDNTAWERFTAAGPLAFLPLSAGRSAVVWTVGKDEGEAISTLTDDAFASRVGALLGGRLGAVTRVGKRQAWPLVRVLAERQRQGRIVLVGNAAHSLHPIAGQGFNLSLRDAAALAEAVANGTRTHDDPAAETELQAWQSAQRPDQERVVSCIDGLNDLFTSAMPGVAPLRGLGIGLFGLWPGGRRAIARYGAGTGGRLPRLARGVPL